MDGSAVMAESPSNPFITLHFKEDLCPNLDILKMFFLIEGVCLVVNVNYYPMQYFVF